jgi:hypothetical protein
MYSGTPVSRFQKKSELLITFASPNARVLGIFLLPPGLDRARISEKTDNALAALKAVACVLDSLDSCPKSPVSTCSGGECVRSNTQHREAFESVEPICARILSRSAQSLDFFILVHSRFSISPAPQPASKKNKPPMHANQVNNFTRISPTRFGFAFPLESFMTWPFRKLMAAALPAL